MLIRAKSILIVVLLVFSCKAWSNPENLSITDFTMHKVTPRQDAPVLKPISDSTVEKKAPAKTTPKPVQKVQKPAKKPTKTAPKPVQKVTKPKPESKPIQKVTKPEPEPKPDMSVILTDIKEEKVDIKDTKAAPKPEQDDKAEYNEQNLVDNLNNYLEQEQTAKNTPQNVEKPSFSTYDHFDYIVKPTLSLGIVLILIFIFAWLYNKLRGINPNALLSGKLGDMDVNRFTVLASSSLGQGKIIHLVEINGKQLVVGSTNNNISLLTEISPEDMEKLQAKADKKRKPAPKPVPEPEPEPNHEIDELENTEPESYSAKYSNVYKDYIE